VRIVDVGVRVTNGTVTITESCGILPDVSGNITFQLGTASAPNNNLINEAKWVRASMFDEPNEFPSQLLVRVQFGTDTNTWWALQAVVPIIGSYPVLFSKIITGQETVMVGLPTWDNTPPSTITDARQTPWDNTGASPITGTGALWTP